MKRKKKMVTGEVEFRREGKEKKNMKKKEEKCKQSFVKKEGKTDSRESRVIGKKMN